MKLMLKHDHQNNIVGYVEQFKYKSLTHTVGFDAVLSVGLNDGLTLGVPYMYFSESFASLKEKASQLEGDGLHRYVASKKPMHSLLTAGMVPVAVKFYAPIDGLGGKSIATSIKILKPIKGLSSETELVFNEVPASSAIEEAWRLRCEDMKGVVKDRESFLRYRCS